MSTYVIGDVHGCYKELRKLFIHLKFDFQKDKVIFVGDLVGRGPNSLEVLSFVSDLKEACIHVLGNHDLRLLAIVYGIISPKKFDYLERVLKSPQLNFYVSWLSASKLIYINEKTHIIVTHAGIPPLWEDISQTKRYADFFENYKSIYGLQKTLEVINSGLTLSWNQKLSDIEILQYVVFGFTKMRFCFENNTFDNQYQCAPGNQPSFLKPWFLLRKNNQSQKFHIIFGHWASLNFYQDLYVTCCDTGCFWGGTLTAIQIEPYYYIHQVTS